ncbi:hypothetical protein ACN42_g3107 [Penicillium freii]|uniref:Uncharacterized protein n=1 Tax=Penicillium freii TaxID=48697 RepID=A0A101MNV0_PENFR|nr:hypothetical protein ACN42_g3107 [Penicillium freii]
MESGSNGAPENETHVNRLYSQHRSLHTSTSIIGLVVEFVVAIDEARVRFTDDAQQFLFVFENSEAKKGRKYVKRKVFQKDMTRPHKRRNILVYNKKEW